MTFTPHPIHTAAGISFQVTVNETALSKDTLAIVTTDALKAIQVTRPKIVAWLANTFSRENPLQVRFLEPFPDDYGNSGTNWVMARPSAAYTSTVRLANVKNVAHLMPTVEGQLQAVLIHELGHLPQRRIYTSKKSAVAAVWKCIPHTTEASVKLFSDADRRVQEAETWCEALALEALKPPAMHPTGLKAALDRAESVLFWGMQPVPRIRISLQPPQILHLDRWTE